MISLKIRRALRWLETQLRAILNWIRKTCHTIYRELAEIITHWATVTGRVLFGIIAVLAEILGIIINGPTRVVNFLRTLRAELAEMADIITQWAPILEDSLTRVNAALTEVAEIQANGDAPNVDIFREQVANELVELVELAEGTELVMQAGPEWLVQLAEQAEAGDHWAIFIEDVLNRVLTKLDERADIGTRWLRRVESLLQQITPWKSFSEAKRSIIKTFNTQNPEELKHIVVYALCGLTALFLAHGLQQNIGEILDFPIQLAIEIFGMHIFSAHLFFQPQNDLKATAFVAAALSVLCVFTVGGDLRQLTWQDLILFNTTVGAAVFILHGHQRTTAFPVHHVPAHTEMATLLLCALLVLGVSWTMKATVLNAVPQQDYHAAFLNTEYNTILSAVPKP